MNIKGKLKKFFTLQHRANDGFTLVELIVVIAIMAILAGVGTVGYSSYITAANKKADMVTVGNVMRALEVGLYSGSYNLKEAVQISDGEEGFKYPVGYVVLTQDGVQSLESATQTSSDEPCKLETVNGPFYVYVTNFTMGCMGSSGTVYQYKKVDSITYCETHYDNPIVASNIVTPSGSNRRYTTYSEAEINADSSKKDEVKNSKNPPGTMYNLGTGYGDDHTDGKVIQKYGNYMANTTDNRIDPVLAAAFGDDFKTAVKLKSPDWTAGTMSTFFNNATGLFAKVETLSGKLVDIIKVAGGTSIGGTQFVKDAHGSSSELVISAADNVLNSTATVNEGGVNKTLTGEEAFIYNWEKVDNSESNATYGSAPVYEAEGFGMAGREYYSAVRLAYNEAFASYLTTNGHSEHASRVGGFGVPASDLINAGGLVGGVVDAVANVTFPQTVCRSALDPESTLADSGIRCQTCLDLYDRYVADGVSRENAKAFFDTMATVNQTGAYANDANNDAGFFDYYENYLNEFQGLTNSVNSMTNGKSSIVIMLYVEDGLLVPEVSPMSANPRLK